MKSYFDDDESYLPARAVWERFGITDMTLWRWLRDERLSFPRPHYFGRNRYWRLADLRAWEATRPRRGAGREAA